MFFISYKDGNYIYRIWYQSIQSQNYSNVFVMFEAIPSEVWNGRDQNNLTYLPWIKKYSPHYHLLWYHKLLFYLQLYAVSRFTIIRLSLTKNENPENYIQINMAIIFMQPFYMCIGVNKSMGRIKSTHINYYKILISNINYVWMHEAIWRWERLKM